MPDVTGQTAIDVVIGLAFFYFLLSIVCSSINEGIATALNLRAKELEKGVRNLLADQTKAADFYAHWRVQALFKPTRFLSRVFKDKRPSYIPSRIFALTVLDTVAPPDKTGTRDLIARARRVVTEEAAKTEADRNETVMGLLQDALDEARDDVDKLRGALERSFDEAMERVSGWYKRRVQLILFVIALALVGAINADSFVIAQRLWKDEALRTAVVAQANATVADENAECAKTEDSSDAAEPTPADIAAKCLDQVKQLGIPLGWSRATSPSGWDILGKVAGLLVTAFAVMLGAPFWFDLLGKVARLRGTGATPTTPTTQTPQKAAATEGTAATSPDA